jgi:hypothetical protein
MADRLFSDDFRLFVVAYQHTRTGRESSDVSRNKANGLKKGNAAVRSAKNHKGQAAQYCRFEIEI